MPLQACRRSYLQLRWLSLRLRPISIYFNIWNDYIDFLSRLLFGEEFFVSGIIGMLFRKKLFNHLLYLEKM